MDKIKEPKIYENDNDAITELGVWAERITEAHNATVDALAKLTEQVDAIDGYEGDVSLVAEETLERLDDIDERLTDVERRIRESQVSEKRQEQTWKANAMAHSCLRERLDGIDERLTDVEDNQDTFSEDLDEAADTLAKMNLKFQSMEQDGYHAEGIVNMMNDIKQRLKDIEWRIRESQVTEKRQEQVLKGNAIAHSYLGERLDGIAERLTDVDVKIGKLDDKLDSELDIVEQRLDALERGKQAKLTEEQIDSMVSFIAGTGEDEGTIVLKPDTPIESTTPADNCGVGPQDMDNGHWECGVCGTNYGKTITIGGVIISHHESAVCACGGVITWHQDVDNPDTKAVDDSETIEGHWECTLCGEVVEPNMVTYEETHDSRYGGCGGKCVWVEKSQTADTSEQVHTDSGQSQTDETQELTPKLCPHCHSSIIVREPMGCWCESCGYKWNYSDGTQELKLICPFCSSDNVSERVISAVRRQFHCTDCGADVYVDSPAEYQSRPIEDELRAEIERREGYERALLSEKVALRKMLNESDDEIANLKADLDKRAIAIGELSNTVEQRDNQIADLKAENELGAKEIERLVTSKAEAVNDWREQRSELSAKIDNLKAENDRLTRKQIQMVREADNLKTENAELRKNCESLNESCDQYEQKNAELQLKMDDIQEERDYWKFHAEDGAHNNQQLEEKLYYFRKDNDELQKRIERLREVVHYSDISIMRDTRTYLLRIIGASDSDTGEGK
jgi:septation ring formation regulator EzrA/ribosomal protein L37AE/L43A